MLERGKSLFKKERAEKEKMDGAEDNIQSLHTVAMVT